jgi:hypothetical protein
MKAIALMIIGALLYSTYLATPLAKTRNGYSEYDMGAVADVKNQRCIASGSGMEDVAVDVRYEEMADALGMFYPYPKPTIALGVTDLDTVTHEVSHFVDHVMMQKGIYDDELEAWLQGGWTKCVYDLVQAHEQELE